MYSYLKPRERSLQAGTQIYNTPMLLAGALEKLERSVDKSTFGTNKPRRAGPGCVVDLLDLSDESQASFELVMPVDAAPRQKRISVLSPLGSGLLGLKVGEISRVNLWGRSHKFLIMGIRYNEPVTTRKEETPS